MPRKFIPRAERETPAARALRAAVAEELEALLGRIPDDGTSKAELKEQREKTSRHIDRVFAKAHAKWDAASSEWREKQAAKILAFQRIYNKSAMLPGDGGREFYAVHKLADDGKPKPGEAGDLYAGHHANAVRARVAASATRPADAQEASTADDESPEPIKRRKRAGHVGYIDPRLFDDDEWED